MNAPLLPRKTREMHSHHFDSTIWNDFVFRNDDIIISTYGKAGTTWMQQIVSQLVFNGETGLPVIGSGPWLAILSLDPETATVIVLREGIIEIRFGDETIVLDRPGEAIALGGTRRSTVFQISAPATARLNALLAPRGVGPRPPQPPIADAAPPPPPAAGGDKPTPPRKPPPRRDPAGGPSDDNYSHDNEAVGGGGGRPVLRRSDGSAVEPAAPAPRRERTYGAPCPAATVARARRPASSRFPAFRRWSASHVTASRRRSPRQSRRPPIRPPRRS